MFPKKTRQLWINHHREVRPFAKTVMAATTALTGFSLIGSAAPPATNPEVPLGDGTVSATAEPFAPPSQPAPVVRPVVSPPPAAVPRASPAPAPPPALTNPVIARDTAPVVAHPFPGIIQVTRPGEETSLIVDLAHPGVRAEGTAYEARSQRVIDFVETTGAVAAVNASFFSFSDYSVVSARPPVHQGESWPTGDAPTEVRPYLVLGNGQADIIENGEEAPPGWATELVPGHNITAQQGQIVPPYAAENDGEIVARQTRHTVVSTTENNRYLILTAPQVAESGYRDTEFAMSDVQAANADPSVTDKIPAIEESLMFDGGGSTQMAIRGQGEVVSSERAVANAIVVHSEE